MVDKWNRIAIAIIIEHCACPKADSDPGPNTDASPNDRPSGGLARIADREEIFTNEDQISGILRQGFQAVLRIGRGRQQPESKSALQS